MTRLLDGIDGLRAAVGEHLGYSDWLTVLQERVNSFADTTGDHQWIHVDPVRSRRESPFGGPIAHGYLTLSLAPALLPQVLEVSGFAMGVNYGCNRVRFMAPVPVGADLRLGAVVKEVEEVPGGVQVVIELTYEARGASKPSCVAEVVFRYFT